MRSLLSVLCVALAAGLSAGCDDNTPTEPTQPIGPFTFSETFSGTMAAGGSQFYSFVVVPAGTVSLMFGSLTPAGLDTPLSVPMAIGIGTPAGTGCPVTSTAFLAPGLTYQLSQALAEGTYCVNIADAGNLSGPADFAIRIVQNPSETEPGEPGTSLFQSEISVGGSASRTFPASTAGTVTLRLDNLSPPPGVEATIGIGLPSVDGTGKCNVTTATVASAPASLSVGVAPGTYCVKIADAGAFIGPTQFTINIVRP